MNQKQYHTTRLERFLLTSTIVFLPLEPYIPSVAGFSVMYLMFGALAGYILANRLRALDRTWSHPVFLASYILLVVASLVESFHPLPSYTEIVRIGQMFAGAIFIASLCRDRQALRAGIYGYVIASVWLSMFLFWTSYGTLRRSVATDFYEASRIRAEVMVDNPLQNNPNIMASITAQGAAAALALVLTARTLRRRYLWLGITLFCLVATFLPMSRGGILIAAISSASVMVASGVKRGNTILVASIIGASVMMLVPEAVWSRMAFSTQPHASVVEGRAQVYTAAVQHLPEYVLTGVGVGNFWQLWGNQNGFAHGSSAVGAHNCFFQVTIYWGLAGLFALIAVIWQARRCLPKHCGGDALALGLLGISTALLISMLVHHNLYAKELSLGLGLVVGARRWVWPGGTVQPVLRRRRYFPLRAAP